MFVKHAFDCIDLINVRYTFPLSGTSIVEIINLFSSRSSQSRSG